MPDNPNGPTMHVHETDLDDLGISPGDSLSLDKLVVKLESGGEIEITAKGDVVHIERE